MTRDDFQKLMLPDEPGVYMFRDDTAAILYIGKAASLRDRVRSYFAVDLAEVRSSAIASMVERAMTVTYESVDTVLEALILEANLIKKHQPHYNVDEKDNKSFNYLVITKEEFPQVLVIRGRELFLKWNSKEMRYVFGPYPHGGALQEAVKLIRKIFPFRDRKCTPCWVYETQHTPMRQQRKGKKMAQKHRLSLTGRSNNACKPCFNRQIGLCPGVCTGEIRKQEYEKTIRNIAELFGGGMLSLKRRLQREMKTASATEEFELAEKLHRQISALTHIRDVSLIKEEYKTVAGGSFRIEAYDVAHTAGAETVGVMTVVSEGVAQKSEYRKFKVQGIGNNDPASLAHVLERRLMHTEWPMPRLIVVDGAKTHIQRAKRVLEKAGVRIPVVSVVKDAFHKPERLLGEQRFIQTYEKDILLANSEAHRFAIQYHRQRRLRTMLL